MKLCNPVPIFVLHARKHVAKSKPFFIINFFSDSIPNEIPIFRYDTDRRKNKTLFLPLDNSSCKLVIWLINSVKEESVCSLMFVYFFANLSCSRSTVKQASIFVWHSWTNISFVTEPFHVHLPAMVHGPTSSTTRRHFVSRSIFLCVLEQFSATKDT